MRNLALIVIDQVRAQNPEKLNTILAVYGPEKMKT